MRKFAGIISNGKCLIVGRTTYTILDKNKQPKTEVKKTYYIREMNRKK